MSENLQKVVASIAADTINYEAIFQPFELQYKRDPGFNILDNVKYNDTLAYMNLILQSQSTIIEHLNELILFSQSHKEDFNNTALLSENSLELNNEVLTQYNTARQENRSLTDQIEFITTEKKENEKKLQSIGTATLDRQFVSLHKDLRGLEFLLDKEIPEQLVNVPPRIKPTDINPIYDIHTYTTNFCVNGTTAASSLNMYALHELFKILDISEIEPYLHDQLNKTPIKTLDVFNATNNMYDDID